MLCTQQSRFVTLQSNLSNLTNQLSNSLSLCRDGIWHHQSLFTPPVATDIQKLCKMYQHVLESLGLKQMLKVPERLCMPLVTGIVQNSISSFPRYVFVLGLCEAQDPTREFSDAFCFMYRRELKQPRAQSSDWLLKGDPGIVDDMSLVSLKKSCLANSSFACRKTQTCQTCSNLQNQRPFNLLDAV